MNWPITSTRAPRFWTSGVARAFQPLGSSSMPRRLFPRIHRWLRPGGPFLAIVGHERWTGVADYLGAPMFWDHADAATYLAWLEADGFDVLWSRFVPEGTTGHTLVLARKPRR
jgi:hypothetical protein